MYCRTCKYALKGEAKRWCPECSRPFDPGDPRSYLTSRGEVPWVRRHPWSAMYCRTCKYALKGAAEHRCPECSRPFDPCDPRTYLTSRGEVAERRVSVTIIVVAVLLGLLILPFLPGLVWFGIGFLNHFFKNLFG